MSAITRETLELAALAAGHMVDIDRSFDDWLAIVGGTAVWCPQINTLDAARLSLHMGMTVEVTDFDVCAALYRDRSAHTEKHDGTQASKERAYCESITQLAAAIGRKKKGCPS